MFIGRGLETQLLLGSVNALVDLLVSLSLTSLYSLIGSVNGSIGNFLNLSVSSVNGSISSSLGISLYGSSASLGSSLSSSGDTSDGADNVVNGNLGVSQLLLVSLDELLDGAPNLLSLFSLTLGYQSLELLLSLGQGSGNAFSVASFQFLGQSLNRAFATALCLSALAGVALAGVALALASGGVTTFCFFGLVSTRSEGNGSNGHYHSKQLLHCFFNLIN